MTEDELREHRANNNCCLHCGEPLDHCGPMPGFAFHSFNLRAGDAERLHEALTLAAASHHGGRVEDDLNYLVTDWLRRVNEPPVKDRIAADEVRAMAKIKAALPQADRR